MAEKTSIPVNVGVVLDLDCDLDGKIALSCIEMALSDFYATHGDYKTKLVLNTRDSMKDVVGAAAAAADSVHRMRMAENTCIPVNVGVVLDLDSDLDGRIALSCIEMALSDFYATHGDYKTRLVLNTRDSMKDVVGAAAAGSPLSLTF
ncbi:hypothetical protein NC652_039030 [Populus alba x Populus x berolinensis]|nr:hypothetical protein NC652_039030 [Populus alba x Populus x berolinensis]